MIGVSPFLFHSPKDFIRRSKLLITPSSLYKHQHLTVCVWYYFPSLPLPVTQIHIIITCGRRCLWGFTETTKGGLIFFKNKKKRGKNKKGGIRNVKNAGKQSKEICRQSFSLSTIIIIIIIVHYCNFLSTLFFFFLPLLLLLLLMNLHTSFHIPSP